MTVYKNSQRRLLVKHGLYFISTNTSNNYPYFTEDIFCHLFLDELHHTQQLKSFEIYGYKINKEHIHLLIQPLGECNYSQIMESLKSNFSRDINRILGFSSPRGLIGPNAGARAPAKNSSQMVPNSPAPKANPPNPAIERYKKYRPQFLKKYGNNHHFPKFKWHPSFFDHLIRCKTDLLDHVRYLRNQWMKHKEPKNKYCFIDEKLVKNPKMKAGDRERYGIFIEGTEFA
ncbi:MAG: transposase [Candidatus Aminicenantes bacterium]|nr:MAG: transposase [Candidatus Aminicenantes bacterium]